MRSTNKNDRISMENLGYNLSKIDTVNTVLFIVGGVICGILGLKSLNGFLFFMFVSVVISICHLFAMKFSLEQYCNMNFLSFTIFGMKNHAMSFVLFWILVYALIHIYKA